MFDEFDKVIRCLAAQLPESVYDDVVEKYNRLKDRVERIISAGPEVPCPMQHVNQFRRDDGRIGCRDCPKVW